MLAGPWPIDDALALYVEGVARRGFDRRRRAQNPGTSPCLRRSPQGHWGRTGLERRFQVFSDRAEEEADFATLIFKVSHDARKSPMLRCYGGSLSPKW